MRITVLVNKEAGNCFYQEIAHPLDATFESAVKRIARDGFMTSDESGMIWFSPASIVSVRPARPALINTGDQMGDAPKD